MNCQGANAELEYHVTACTLDALAVNATSGDVTVQDARLLDRELNDTIECEVLFTFAFIFNCSQRNIFVRLNTTPNLYTCQGWLIN